MKYSIRYYLIVFQFIIFLLTSADAGTAQVVRLDLPSIERRSDLIIRACVLSLQPKWVNTPGGRNIITTVNFRILEVIKGDLPDRNNLDLEIPGGTIAETTQYVTSSVQFSPNEDAILFLQKNPLSVIGEFQGKYTVYEDKVQIGGLLVDSGQFTGILRKAASKPRVLPDFLNECENAERAGEDLLQQTRLKSGNSTNLPLISSISPDKTSAGTDTDVTIYGSNFGSSQGTGKVQFFYQTGLPKIPGQVVTWSDTEIVCKVPILTGEGRMESAASGPVTVISSSGQASNPYIFKVTFGYGQIKWPDNFVQFKVNENLTSLENEGQAIITAANTWNNTNSGFILQYAGSHTNTDFAQNNSNEIMWGTFSSSTTIGRATLWFTGGTIQECDIVFNNDFKWSNTADVPYDHMDIETVALHELGHWLNLRDLYGNLGDEEYDKAKVMYGFGSYGLRKRNLHTDDIEGINWIYGRPATFNISGFVRTSEGLGVEEVILSGLPANPTTNTGGYYSADVDNGWSGTVTPEKSGYTFTPAVHTYVNQSNTVTDQDFTAFKLSTDATLSDIKVNSVTITGFNPSTPGYSLELPYGTTAVPTVTVTTTHVRATKVITPSVSLPGSTMILVTAEDGTTQKTYTVSFTVAKNNDATLSDLAVNGSSVSGFDKTILVYGIVLPYGTVVVPVTTATTTDPKAVKLITPANALPGSTQVLVTAENGTTSLTYTVNFTLEPPSTDASLSDLMLDGSTIKDFSPEVTGYEIELPYGTTKVPVVTARAHDARATLEIAPATSLPGISTVRVIAEDGVTSIIYSVGFTLAKNHDATLSDLMINGNTVEGFNSGIHSYQAELPFGTVKVPLVTAITSDGHADMTITPPESLPGETIVHVVAENGIVSLDYTVEFTFTPPSHDATLSDLRVNGLTLAGFRSGTFNYSIEFPHGQQTIPEVSATVSQKDAEVTIIPADSLPGEAFVMVTAQDRVTRNTYSLIFSVARNNDATLSDLRVNDSTISGFLPSMLTYTVILPPENTVIPSVTATTTDETAVKTITLPAMLPGVAAVKVTAEDGITFQTYEITLRYPLSGIDETYDPVIIRIFPNPNNGSFQVSYKALHNNILTISVLDLQGRVLYNRSVGKSAPDFSGSIQLKKSPSGLYLLRIIDGSTVSYHKFIID